MKQLPKPIEIYYITVREDPIFLYGRDTVVDNVRDLVNEIISIDGVLYQVRGVEHWVIACEGPCKHGFGLLVKEVAGKM